VYSLSFVSQRSSSSTRERAEPSLSVCVCYFLISKKKVEGASEDRAIETNKKERLTQKITHMLLMWRGNTFMYRTCVFAADIDDNLFLEMFWFCC
jgi:hypothetical protein